MKQKEIIKIIFLQKNRNAANNVTSPENTFSAGIIHREVRIIYDSREKGTAERTFHKETRENSGANRMTN